MTAPNPKRPVFDEAEVKRLRMAFLFMMLAMGCFMVTWVSLAILGKL